MTSTLQGSVLNLYLLTGAVLLILAPATIRYTCTLLSVSNLSTQQQHNTQGPADTILSVLNQELIRKRM